MCLGNLKELLLISSCCCCCLHSVSDRDGSKEISERLKQTWQSDDLDALFLALFLTFICSSSHMSETNGQSDASNSAGSTIKRICVGLTLLSYKLEKTQELLSVNLCPNQKMVDLGTSLSHSNLWDPWWEINFSTSSQFEWPSSPSSSRSLEGDKQMG